MSVVNYLKLKLNFINKLKISAKMSFFLNYVKNARNLERFTLNIFYFFINFKDDKASRFFLSQLNRSG